ncbi:Epidermal patterning factor 2-like [Thalictrum thalictroides]|uniref:Epidermal patterning factor-like protein n=1 Tax=Thalictrum thalictroides TaxID=46969 RepID=A0A7J6WY08_THATH|nr:Epidermal patterning factor 2-like [Thalictrum thalictroides]
MDGNGLGRFQNISVGLKNEGNFGRGRSNVIPKGEVEEEVGIEMEMEMYATGSSLPDCAHACGPCNPCKRVMVSFRCPMAKSFPVVYRCMCGGKYYQVPSN